MKIVAINAEYNPLHNGHAHHLKMSRELNGHCGIVVVMSGYFCQRGLPAIISPYTRAQQAILAGADLVLRLPTSVTSASAEDYAFGVVYALSQLQAHKQSFGYEPTCTVDQLKAVAQYLVEESEQDSNYQAIFQTCLKQGMGIAKARELALKKINPEWQNICQKSNQILAIEYLKAGVKLKDHQPVPAPFLLRREGDDYLANEVNSSFASATAIRQKIASASDLVSLAKELKPLMPLNSLALLLRDLQAKKYKLLDDYSSLIATLLWRETEHHANKYRYLSADLCARLQESVAEDNFPLLSELVTNCSSRQFPHSRIQRALISLLLNIPEDISPKAQYLQVLAFNKTGRYLLKRMKQDSTLPIVSNFSDLYKQELSIDAQLQRDLDRRACQIWHLGQRNTLELLREPLYIH